MKTRNAEHGARSVESSGLPLRLHFRPNRVPKYELQIVIVNAGGENAGQRIWNTGRQESWPRRHKDTES